MSDVLLFPFADYWWLYAGFTAFVLVLLALDLGVFHRQRPRGRRCARRRLERGLDLLGLLLQLRLLPVLR